MNMTHGGEEQLPLFAPHSVDDVQKTGERNTRARSAAPPRVHLLAAVPKSHPSVARLNLLLVFA